MTSFLKSLLGASLLLRFEAHYHININTNNMLVNRGSVKSFSPKLISIPIPLQISFCTQWVLILEHNLLISIYWGVNWQFPVNIILRLNTFLNWISITTIINSWSKQYKKVQVSIKKLNSIGGLSPYMPGAFFPTVSSYVQWWEWLEGGRVTGSVLCLFFHNRMHINLHD